MSQYHSCSLVQPTPWVLQERQTFNNPLAATRCRGKVSIKNVVFGGIALFSLIRKHDWISQRPPQGEWGQDNEGRTPRSRSGAPARRALPRRIKEYLVELGADGLLL